MDMKFNERLESLRVLRSLSKNAFAVKCDIKPTTMLGYLNGTSEPNLEALLKITDTYNVPVGWLAAGEGEPGSGEKKGEEYSYIPLLNVAGSAGTGAFVEDEMVLDLVAFRTSWLRSVLRVDPAQLKLIRVQGDSMEPSLSNGDTVLVDLSVDGHLSDGIWVIKMDGVLKIKRVQQFPGGKVSIISDNTAYAPIEIDTTSLPPGLEFVGRVVWAGRWV